MKSVTQKHEFGCGAACVAFISKKSYSKAIALLGKKKATNQGYYCKDLCKALIRLNLIYSYKYLKPGLKRKIYKDGTIVFIKRSKQYPSGHYLVRYNSLWMDPWINFNKDRYIKQAKSGFRKKLPGKPIYGLFPI